MAPLEARCTDVSNGWYSRPVLSVRDTLKALVFYSSKLGFKEDWRYEEDGRARILQVSRQGCELILCDQWPNEAGRGLIFISLDIGEFTAIKADMDRRGVEMKSGFWGYPLLIVEDPDGNRLWFPEPEGSKLGE